MASAKDVAALERKFREAKTNKERKQLKEEIAKLKSALTTEQKTTTLPKERKKVKQMPDEDFSDFIKRLKAKPEYKFLSGMSAKKIKDDKRVVGKPVGWRVKGKNNYKVPSAKFRRDNPDQVYFENRVNRSDVKRANRLEDGGMMAKGGNFSDNMKQKKAKLLAELKEVNDYLKRLENINTKEAYEESNNARNYRSILEAKLLHLEKYENGGSLKKKDDGVMPDAAKLSKSYGTIYVVKRADGEEVTVPENDLSDELNYSKGKVVAKYVNGTKQAAEGGMMAKGGKDYVFYGVTKSDNVLKIISEHKTFKAAEKKQDDYWKKGLNAGYSKTGVISKANFEKDKAFLKFAKGGGVSRGKNQKIKDWGKLEKGKSMLYFLQNEASSGSIANKVKYSNYKDIDGVRLTAIQMLMRDGDRPYSLQGFNQIVREAADEYAENQHESQFAQGGGIDDLYTDAEKRSSLKGQPKFNF